jgi:hypothetical protein
MVRSEQVGQTSRLEEDLGGCYEVQSAEVLPREVSGESDRLVSRTDKNVHYRRTSGNDSCPIFQYRGNLETISSQSICLRLIRRCPRVWWCFRWSRQ